MRRVGFAFLSILLIPGCDGGSPAGPRPSVRLDVIESILHTSPATGRTTLATRVVIRNPTFISVEPVLCSFRLQRIVAGSEPVTLARGECAGQWGYVTGPHTEFEHSYSVTLPSGDPGTGSEYVIGIPIFLEGERSSSLLETDPFTPTPFRQP